MEKCAEVADKDFCVTDRLLDELAVRELRDLELAAVGGGIGDVVGA